MKYKFAAKTITLLIILAVVVGGAYIWGLMSLAEGKARIESLAAEVEKAKLKSEEIAAVRQALDEFKSYQEEIENHLIAPDGIVSFVEQVEEVAKEAGVTLKIDFLEEGESEPKLSGVGRLRIGLSAQGAFEDVVKFGALLDALPYQVFVAGATLATDKSTREDPKKRLWGGGWSLSVPKLKELKPKIQ